MNNLYVTSSVSVDAYWKVHCTMLVYLQKVESFLEGSGQSIFGFQYTLNNKFKKLFIANTKDHVTYMTLT